MNARAVADFAPPAPAVGESPARVVSAVSLNTYARGGETPLEITYSAWLSLSFAMPPALADACADGGARIYRVAGDLWTPVPHRCETNAATGATFAVVLLNRFSDYVMTIAQTARRPRRPHRRRRQSRRRRPRRRRPSRRPPRRRRRRRSSQRRPRFRSRRRRRPPARAHNA